MATNDPVVIKADPDLEDIIPGYLKNRDDDISKISEALAKGDYETIRVLGHTMKGTGGGYGFDTITTLGHAIEVAAKERNREGIQRSIKELSAYLNRVEVIYEE